MHVERTRKGSGGNRFPNAQIDAFVIADHPAQEHVDAFGRRIIQRVGNVFLRAMLVLDFKKCFLEFVDALLQAVVF
jgi:hypothetical protein